MERLTTLLDSYYKTAQKYQEIEPNVEMNMGEIKRILSEYQKLNISIEKEFDLDLGGYFDLFHILESYQETVRKLIPQLITQKLIDKLRLSVSYSVIEHLEATADDIHKEFNWLIAFITNNIMKWATAASTKDGSLQPEKSQILATFISGNFDPSAILGTIPPLVFNVPFGSDIDINIDLLYDKAKILRGGYENISPNSGISAKAEERFSILKPKPPILEVQMTPNFKRTLAEEIVVGRKLADAILESNRPKVTPEAIMTAFKEKEKNMLQYERQRTETKLSEFGRKSAVDLIDIRYVTDLSRALRVQEIRGPYEQCVRELRRLREFTRDTIHEFEVMRELADNY